MNNSPLTHRKDIDGLRAIAVLTVVIFHGFPDAMSGGFIGVDIFFVISGFLITKIIVTQIDQDSFSLKHFYQRRIRRIFPALITVLIAVSVIGFLILPPAKLILLGRHIAAGALFVPNFLLWSEVGYFDKQAAVKPLLHLWSLGIEEQFYIFWPLVLVALSRWRIRWIVILILLTSFMVNILSFPQNATAGFYSPASRSWELLLGAILVIYSAPLKIENSQFLCRVFRTLASISGLALIFVSAFIVTKETQFPYWWALAPTAGAALFLWAGPNGPGNLLISNPVMEHIGKISYPLYLWHWPLLSFGFIYLGEETSTSVRVGLILISFLLAQLTYQYIEKPIRFGSLSKYAIHFSAASMAAIAFFGVFLFSSDGIVSRFPASIRAVLAQENYPAGKFGRAPECWLAANDDHSKLSPICYGNKTIEQNRSLVLWGDSHAASIYPGFNNLAGARLSISQFTRDSCPPLLGYGPKKCRAGNEHIIEKIRKMRPDIVVLYAVWNNYSADWDANSRFAQYLLKTLDEVKKSGVKKIVVVGPFSSWKAALPDILFRKWTLERSSQLPERLAGFTRAIVFPAGRQIGEIAKLSGATYVSITDFLCEDAGCRTYVPGRPEKLISWDYGHLTAEGAGYLVENLIAKHLK